ncbi:MAG: endonuclease/exonuclease/phosphatase family protein [Saprospiraceae bacterium]
MSEDAYSKKASRLFLSGILLLPALLVIFAPAVYSFKWFVDYSLQVMFLYLGLGFIFLFLTKNFWLAISWGACIFLCIFLKYTSNQAFSFEKPSGGKIITVANYNISFVDSVQNIIESIRQNNAQLISIQEVTPDLDTILIEGLKSNYPYHFSLKRADFYGMMIFSALPFEKIDTFQFGEIPNIIGNLKVDGTTDGFNFIVSYCPPSFSSSTYLQLKAHLKVIANYAKNESGPLITMGTYNTVPWAPEVQDFKKIAKLNDSRLGIAPAVSSSSNPLFQIPIDHIFHSEKLKCTNFKALSYNQHAHLGIEGSFEILP